MTQGRLSVLFFRPGLVQGGADRVTVTLLKHLSRKDFEPHLCLFQRGGELIPEVPRDVPIYYLNADSIAQSASPLRRLIARRRPDVVFSTSSGTNALVAAVGRAGGSGTRVVLSERAMLTRPPMGMRRRIQLGLKAITYRNADCITAVSEGVKHDLQKRIGIDDAVVVYNPMIPPDFEQQCSADVAEEWLSAPESYDCIVTMGRLVQVKDHATLIKAFAQVRAKNDRARLLILGDGPLRDSLQAKVETLGLNPSVRFLGFRVNPFPFVAKAKCFVLSSTQEGLPGALIQAMAAAVPAVSTDCPSGPSEIITSSGDNGFLVPVGDDGAIANSISMILCDDERARRIGLAGAAAVERFSVNVAIERYASVLQSKG